MEEDLDLEMRLQQNFLDFTGSNPPKLSPVAPAALYLTALLEYVILSSDAPMGSIDLSNLI